MQDNNTKVAKPLHLTQLPDELISMCYAHLPATDLVTLEQVSPHLHALIATDGPCWKRATHARWPTTATCNPVLLHTAMHLAGSWKALYTEKAESHHRHAPWHLVTKSETLAIIHVIAPPALVSAPPAEPSPPLPMSAPSWLHAPTQHVAPPHGPCTPPTVASVALPSSRSPTSVVPLPTLSIVLLIDASSSVTDEDFGCMKSFSKCLVEHLHDMCARAHVGIVQFNQHPRVELPLTPVAKAKLPAAIDSMDQMMGSTDIAAPIRRARQMLLEEALPGDRVIVLLTDGQTHADELLESEREARKAGDEVGARLYTLGVGRDIDEGGLARVAAGAPGGMHFTLRRFVHGK